MPIQVAKVREFKGHTQAIYTLSNAGENDSFFSAGADGMVVEWSVNENDGKLLARFEYPIYSLYLHNEFLFCGGNNGALTIVNILTKHVVKQFIPHSSAIFDIIFHHHHFLLAHIPVPYPF